MSGFGDFFMGTKERTTQTPNFNPQQMTALQQLLGSSMQGLQGNKFDFAPIEQQARQGFQQQTVPGIAERFSQMGSDGGQRSSAFAGSLGQAGAGLEGNLASMRQGYGMQQQGNLMQQLQMALQPQFSTQFRPAQSGFLPNFAGRAMGGGAEGLMKLLPLLMGL